MPFCQVHCPLANNIPDWLKLTAENRLQEAHSFRETANVLRMTRASVAWSAVGCSRGAYEHALAYAEGRTQFGKPLVDFQLVQDLLERRAAARV